MEYSLQKAIMAKYNSAEGADLRALVTGGMYDTMSPNDSIFNYITFEITGSDLNQDFCNNFYDVGVTFTIYGDANNKSASGVLLIGREFLLLYQDILLNPMEDGWQMIRNNTVSSSKDIDGQKGWNLQYDFEFLLEKVR